MARCGHYSVLSGLMYYVHRMHGYMRRALSNDQRATGRGFCQAIASPIVVITPLIAAWLISQFGGFQIEGIRLIYALHALIFIVIFIVAIAIDVFLRLPLLAITRETLHLRK